MTEECAAAASVCGELNVNWLLHRAAQRLDDAVRAEAARHGISMRAQLILAALRQQAGRTQLALGNDLAVDKTTLTSELDRMEACGLIQRLPDPKDRRVRIPEITETGIRMHAEAAESIKQITDRRLAVLEPAERAVLEKSLRRLVEADDQAV
ncbi:MAG TPA: MarR family transcriptional regulator [Pseudonocardiaceae bacterium]|nr:MarR family transcriptional regulator [Pseudonocardiaceae bacterium]